MTRILIIEDELALREEIVDILTFEGSLSSARKTVVWVSKWRRNTYRI